MFKMNNRENFYLGKQEPKLSKAELLYLGLLVSGAVELDHVPIHKASDEIDYVENSEELNHDLFILASLYEHCRRFAARHEDEQIPQ